MLRRNAVRLLALIPIALLAAGCAPLTVSSHIERGADFGRYHTFAWDTPDALPTGDPRLDNNPFFRDYLQGAVERQLRTRGIMLANTAEFADLRIHYHAAVTERFALAGSGRPPADCAEDCEPRVVDYDESTIVLDMVDAQTNRLVWRGWAQEDLRSVIDSQDRMEKHIERAVERMLARLPL
jgi:hypothetical protein